MDRFQEDRKQALIDQGTQMGMDTFAVQDLIEEKGIWFNNRDILMQAMNNPSYVNPLKIPKALNNYGSGAP